MTIRNALVVDDSKSSRFALRRLLEGFGCNVDTAASVAEAYGLMRDRRPQIMLLDHLMPDINGLDALAEMRDDPQFNTVPVVICSSNEGHDFVEMAESRGATAVLRKPPTPEEVRSVLEYVNGLSHAPTTTPAAPLAVVEPIFEAVAMPAAPRHGSKVRAIWEGSFENAAPRASVVDFPELMLEKPQPRSEALDEHIDVAEFASLDFHSESANEKPPEEAFDPEQFIEAEYAPAEEASAAAAPPAREAVPQPSESLSRWDIAPAASRAASPEPPPAAATATAPAAPQIATRNDDLRDEFEKRLRRVTQDLFVTIAEIRSQLSNHDAFLEFREPQIAQQIRGLEARLDQMASEQATAMQLLRSELDARLRAQEERLSSHSQPPAPTLDIEAIRREARDEAKRVAEQAAIEMSQKLAQSLLGALRLPAA